MEKILTIIIPTYNMEALLRRTLDSLLIPAGREQLDVIVVNDGSKDASSAIAHTYADRFPETFRVVDKPNGNYGSCINAALPLARGRYVKILDADDYFDTTALAAALPKLDALDADLVLTPFNTHFAATDSIHTFTPPYAEGQRLNPDETEIVQHEMHSVIYSTPFLRSAGYTQSEGISYTDAEWTLLPMLTARSVTTISDNIYQYLIGREGQTMDADVLARRVGELEQIVGRMLSAAAATPLTPPRKAFIDTYIRTRLNIIFKIELVKNDTTNTDALARLDAQVARYDTTLHAALGKKTYVRLFRHGILIPKWIRHIIISIQRRKKRRRR